MENLKKFKVKVKNSLMLYEDRSIEENRCEREVMELLERIEKN